MAVLTPLWEASYMESPLQRLVRLAVEAAPKARDHYDKEIQKIEGSKGKPLYDIMRGKSANPNTRTLQSISKVLGLPLDLMQRAIAGEDVEPGSVVTAAAHTRPVVQSDTTAEIIKLDMSLAMGDGTNIDDFIEETSYRFDLDYVRSITRTPPHRLRIATGIGDSMFPTLLPSDAIWFDTTQTVLNLQDKIWACSIRGGGAIKRLRLGPNRKIIVLSDNPAVPPDEVDEDDLRIFGRAIHLGRNI